MTEMTQIVGGGLLAMGIVKLSFDFINKQSMDKRLERLENLGLRQLRELYKINGKKN